MLRMRSCCKWAGLSVAALLLLVVTALVVAQKKARLFDPARMALVDVVGQNYLFRGNNPFVGIDTDGDGNGDGAVEFAYPQLTEQFSQLLVQKGHQPLGKYHLIDISLLDIDQYRLIEQERTFFDNNPALGSFIHVSTVSPGILFTSMSSPLGALLTAGYNDDVHALVQLIRDQTKIQKDVPVVVYVHCDAGRDRTGFVMASYRMVHQHMSMRDAIRQNVLDSGRSSRDYYANATGSFCRYVGNSTDPLLAEAARANVPATCTQ